MPDHQDRPAGALAHGPAKCVGIERVRRDVDEADARSVRAGGGFRRTSPTAGFQPRGWKRRRRSDLATSRLLERADVEKRETASHARNRLQMRVLSVVELTLRARRSALGPEATEARLR